MIQVGDGSFEGPKPIGDEGDERFERGPLFGAAGTRGPEACVSRREVVPAAATLLPRWSGRDAADPRLGGIEGIYAYRASSC